MSGPAKALLARPSALGPLASFVRRAALPLYLPPSSASPLLVSSPPLRFNAGSRFGFHGRRFCSSGVGVRAAQVSDSGSIDSPMMQSMERKIKEQLNAEMVTVKDAYGDGRHVSIDVVSAAFEGQSAVNRQRMVYKAIWEELQSTVHAVDQMTTRTPVEAAGNK